MTCQNNNPSNDLFDIAIIGAGASGMAAAWYAQKWYREKNGRNCSISLFERNERPGKKLLMTGNGRCNLTNLDNSITRFHGGDVGFAKHALSLFPPEKTIALFGEMGVVCTVEEEKKVFPASLHASSVLDALRCALDDMGIGLHTATMISSVKKDGNHFILRSSGNKTCQASSVIVATGGMCAPATGSDGSGYRLLGTFSHQLAAVVPCIVQLRTDISFVKPLSGNKINGTATLYIDNKPVRHESGEILFTDYGLSGPPVLQLSGYVSRALQKGQSGGHLPEIAIEIDFLPAISPDNVAALLNARKASFPARKLEEYLTGLFHRRLAYGLLKASIDKPLSATVSSLTVDNITALAHSCKALRVAVHGTMPFSNAQATGGGILTSGFNPATMESTCCPGLFACGEVLDIDGDCGGFNLQWAWASGFLAGQSAAANLARHQK